MAQARHSPQTISWFWDLYQRGLLELDPPYQRKSVWNNVYKAYFIVRRDKAQRPSGCKSHPAKFDRSSRKLSERRWR
jgi:hypothetical protein